MHLVPVLDLCHGGAVHARGGNRAQYGPLESALLADRPAGPLALARAFREVLGATLCYVADLDAIAGRPLQRDLLRELAHPGSGFGSGLLVDGGVTGAADARALLGLGAGRVVVGSERLSSPAQLAAMVDAVGAERAMFSLDLRLGRPLWGPAAAGDLLALAPWDVVARAVEAGFTWIVVLDLGRVGNGQGPDFDLVAGLRRRCPEVGIMVGGGIRGRDDLLRLAGLGCHGALVATALHTGALQPGDFEAMARY